MLDCEKIVFCERKLNMYKYTVQYDNVSNAYLQLQCTNECIRYY